LTQYEYAIGTTSGGSDVKTWTSTGTTASMSDSALTLQTSKVYYVSVRTTDAAGNVSSPITSDGQFVAPSLSFSVSPSTITFSNLNSVNNYTDSKTTTLTTSTNAYGGYIVRQAADGFLRSRGSVFTIPDFNGGTYASPNTWQSGNTGVGYTSSDTLVQGANKFQSATCPGGQTLAAPGCFAPYTRTLPGNIIADHTAAVTGSAISNEQFTVTHRITIANTQAASDYTMVLIYTATALY
jgi:hypothetical protein